jgi:monofunctional biosynthetic peptidoglycan transglycosylase
LALVNLMIVLPLRWIPPPVSAVMVWDRLGTILGGDGEKSRIDYRWTDWEDISPHAALAVMASEDQKFPYHRGFDLEAIADAVGERLNGRRLRGASTITQQVAKNLYLWQGKSFWRKGLEAWLTVLIEACWNKRRILEVYLNIAEFGRHVYGVGAASRHYFSKPPSELTLWESSRLAAVLPNPRRMNPGRPSGYVISRAVWIQKQVRLMGGMEALKPIGH